MPNLLHRLLNVLVLKRATRREAFRLRAAGAGALVVLAGAIYLAGMFVAVGVLTGPGSSVYAAGSCEAVGLIPVGDTGLCTHGPDPEPPGVDASVPDEPVFGAADFSHAVCTGNGADGRRVQVIYARPFDVPSRLNEYRSSFRTWAAQASQIVTDSAAQTGGARYIRFVHDSNCVIDIQSVTLSAAGASDFNTMVYEMTAKGYGRWDRKYLIFLDVGNDDICGLGTVYPDDSPSAGNTNNNVKGYAEIYNGCWSSTRTIVHELTHNMGAVQASSPNHTPWSHCTDEWDIMCYEDGSGWAMRIICPDPTYQGLLDCNHNDYFNTNPSSSNYLYNHWNNARSGWLGSTGAPPPSTVPFNDVIANALPVGALPWLHETNTLWATTSPGDPIPENVNCWSYFSKTIWYRFTVPEDGDYGFDTVGSSYDTVVATFSGTPASLTQLKCNDDLDDISLDSRVKLTNLKAGTTIYIMVGAFYRPSVEDIPTPGGYLRFNVQRLPKITLAPTSGGYAANVTLTLSKFLPNTTVALTWDGAALRSHGSPVTIQTDSQGNGQGVFPVPSGVRGYHTIEGSGGGASATVRFKVTPRLRISPSGGGIGSSVRISLTGYEAGETVKIRWKRPDGVYVTVPVVLSNGSTTTAPAVSSQGSGSYTIVVPAYAGAGPTTVRAAGTATTSNAAVTFTVAACAPSPTTVYAGRAISLPCAGFLPGETVDIYWKSSSSAPIATFVTGQDGSGIAGFKAPAATRGAANLIARGRISGRSVVSPVTVTSYLRLTPASGPGATTVGAKVYGFRAGEKVCVRRTFGATTITITCSLTADAVGSSPTFSFVMPADASTGPHTVTATGDQGSSATRTFNVTAQAAEPTVPPSPTSSATATPAATATEPVPPSATPTATDTATPVPTAPDTPVPTDTAIPTEASPTPP